MTTKKTSTLVIVESPTKAKTIGRFLGKQFRVESSYGHVRDLPRSQLGIDVEHDFAPKYITPRKNSKRVTALKKIAKKAGDIILATDEDREGEAIAWHLAEILDIKEPKRIVFHEITEKAITSALEHPRAIDMMLVDAQQARRILDRLVGYALSPFLWKKVMRGLSAGRVQSVALRLIVEREAERKAFTAEEYWSVEATLADAKKITFDAEVSQKNGKTLDKFALKTATDADVVKQAILSSTPVVEKIESRELKKKPNAPYTTSTLQQDASRRLGYSAKQTMWIAQSLYEGVDLPEGSTGLITYMRTDSVNLSKDAVAATTQFLSSTYGAKYAAPEGRTYTTKSKGAQEAHEAIRPTDVLRTPESVHAYLDPKQRKLYTLIWQRFVASQMPDAELLGNSIHVRAGDYGLRASGQHITFDGFLKVWPAETSENNLPTLNEGETLTATDVRSLQHFTQPPARYSEATLIKALEEFGIGRPSTYAPTIGTLTERNYVERDDAKKLFPTEVGEIVNGLLVAHFPKIVDTTFTATMERSLDEIAEGKPWVPIIRDFYTPFAKLIEEKLETVPKRDMTEETGEMCELCGKPLIIKYGRFGRFIACSGFPECRNTKKLPPEPTGLKCPECHEGDIVARKTKKNRKFFGCSRYPDCNYATWKLKSKDDKDDAPNTNGAKVPIEEDA